MWHPTFQHARANCLVLVKGKDEIRPAGPLFVNVTAAMYRSGGWPTAAAASSGVARVVHSRRA
jgi:hypothetical protein